MSLGTDQSQAVNITDVFRGLGRRKGFVSALTLAGLLIGAALVFTSKPSFLSEAQVIVENTATSYERAATDPQAIIQPLDERYIAGQVAVIKSSDLLGRVVDSMGLQNNPELNPALTPGGTLKSILIATGFSDDPAQYSGRDNAIKSLGTKLSISSSTDSNVITITSRMHDKKIAADAANALTEFYVGTTRDNEAGSTDRARQWLSSQINDLRVKVSDSENAVEKYRSEAGLLKGQLVTLGAQQISELNTQITVAETAAGESAARAAEIKSLLSSGSIEASSDVLNSPLIQNLREQQTTAARKISELSAVYLPNHPKMIAAEKELAVTNAQIKREALKVVESLQGQAKIANARAALLRTSLEKSKGRESEANVSDVKLKSLERDAQANRTLLENMLARYADVSARQDANLQPAKARIIQKATIAPTPYFPKIGPTIFLTTMAGLGLGLALAFIMEVMSSAARTAAPMRVSARNHVALINDEEEYKVPPMQVQAVPTPSIKTGVVEIKPLAHVTAIASSFAALEKLNSDAGDFKVEHALVSACQSLRENKGIKAFSFISIGSVGPDSSMAAIAIARELAGLKKRVVVVDAAQKGGELEMFIGLPAGTGLTDLLAGLADFTKIVARDPKSTVHIIRKGISSEPQNNDAVASKLESVISALVSIYDYVFVHAGEANAATPHIVKNCPAAFIFASAVHQNQALSAAQVLHANGVLTAMLVQVDQARSEDVRQAASA